MKFVRAIWKLLVGIKDALVLVFMLLFFGLLYVGLSAKPQPVGEGVLAVDLDGSVVEQPASPPSRSCWRDRQPLQYRLRDLIAALDEARTTTASKRSRSTSTASSAAARRRCPTCPTRCGACALRESR